MEVQLLKKHGFSLRAIAREVGCAVNTVRRQLRIGEQGARASRPERVARIARPRKLAAFEGYLRGRQAAAAPLWIPATVLFREIVERGYEGGQSQLRAFMRSLKPRPAVEALVRFETAPGEQMQVDWVEFRAPGSPVLYAFCATLGYSRASFVEFVSDMKVDTLIACHEHAFASFGGVVKKVLYDNMKTVVLERDHYGDGQHRFHAGFLDYAHHSGFVIKLCRPYRAKTKGKVERFNGYLRRSFYVPLVSRLRQEGAPLDVRTANIEVAAWLTEVANTRLHGTTGQAPAVLLNVEREHLQARAPAWRGTLAGARPVRAPEQANQGSATDATVTLASLGMTPHPVEFKTTGELPTLDVPQHPLAVFDALLRQIQTQTQTQIQTRTPTPTCRAATVPAERAAELSWGGA